jgi:predicted enzyme related to lactoylglutathione lyase
MQKDGQSGANKGRVIGFGGTFMRTGPAADVVAWYGRTLGIAMEPGYVSFAPPSSGYNVFSAMAPDSGYFAPSTAAFMLNFIVDDLAALLERLEAQGVTILGRDMDDPHGLFAWIIDPWDTKIELWQPSPAQAEQAAGDGLEVPAP